MTRRNSSGENVKNQAERTAKQAAAHPWVERLARFGIASQGVVYMVVDILATQAAFGAGGQTTDTQGSLRSHCQSPFGTFLLSLVAVGLIGYVIWRFGFGACGVVFGVIGIFLIQAGLQSNSKKVQGLDGALQELARQPFGPWILGAVAIGLVAYGIYMTLAQARYRRVVTT